MEANQNGFQNELNGNQIVSRFIVSAVVVGMPSVLLHGVCREMVQKATAQKITVE